MQRPADAAATTEGPTMNATITLSPDLLPKDGRFGAGPSKVRPEQLQAVLEHGTDLMGTSHRQAPVRQLVARLRQELAELFRLPEGYEVVLGNGGATSFWDAAAVGLVRSRAAHLSFGEFGSKFAQVTQEAPFLEDSDVVTSAPGSRPAPLQAGPADVYAWPQNETSTGVCAEVRRPEGLREDDLVLVDATSAAGGMEVDVAEADVYYFSPQKNFASDGGLWVALFSPRALARVEEITASDRWIPDSLNLKTAVENSRKDQTYNTPALATLVMLTEQVRWINAQGGLGWAASRTAESSAAVYSWAEQNPLAHPFVEAPEHRSPVITTVDFEESVDAARVAAVLREHGVVDVEPYRKLGRNQLRIATFVAIEPADVRALLACIDQILPQLPAPA